MAKEISSLRRLNQSFPPATAARPHSRGDGKPLQIVVPAECLKALKRKAVEEETSVRALVLKALAKDGYPVDAEFIDRRRKG